MELELYVSSGIKSRINAVLNQKSFEFLYAQQNWKLLYLELLMLSVWIENLWSVLIVFNLGPLQIPVLLLYIMNVYGFSLFG